MTAITHTWLVAYDISDDKRRSSLHKMLRGYGQPLQKSVFLCHLTPKKAARMRQDLAVFQTDPCDRITWVTVTSPETLPLPSSIWIME
ncbi:MAG: CRISPR-associated endonuclease Cas2 [Methylococcaceae bacterium]|nr:CRISPR-associated endonuclease Cas2 [Methylococcaceae bacterium]